MSSATGTTLIQRTRRFLGDWPENDASTASISSGGTALTVADTTIYSPGWIIQQDDEAMYVSSLASATSLTVRRGVRGTTAASHASGATVLVRPHFLNVEYLDALNAGIQASFPQIYKPVQDTSLVSTGSVVYEYTIPNLDGIPIPYLSRIDFLETSDQAYRVVKDWDVVRGSVPKLKFKRPLPPGTIRLYGFGAMQPLATSASTMDALFPTIAEDAIVYFAGSYLLASGEARRVREDVGARDDREQANRLGGSSNASQLLLQRFYTRMAQVQMSPMPKNVKSVI